MKQKHPMSKAPPAYANVAFYRRWHTQHAKQLTPPTILTSKPLGRLVRELEDCMAIATIEQGSRYKCLLITCDKELLWTSRHGSVEQALSFAQSKFEDILAGERHANLLATHQSMLFDVDEFEPAPDQDDTEGQAIA